MYSHLAVTKLETKKTANSHCGTDDVVNLDILSDQILTFTNKTKFPNSFYISIKMLMSSYIYDLKLLCSDWEKYRVTRSVRFIAPLIISKAAFVTRSLLEKLGLYVLSFNSFTNTLILCQRGKPIYIFIVRNEQTYKQHHVVREQMYSRVHFMLKASH